MCAIGKKIGAESGWEALYNAREGGAERAGTVAESAPAVAIPRASHDIGDVLHISHVTYVKI